MSNKSRQRSIARAGNRTNPVIPGSAGDQIARETSQKVVIQRQQWSAPLPQPSDFEKYELIVPGSANRILTLAEGEAEHRRFIEKEVVRSQNSESERFYRDAFLGKIFAFILVVFGFTLTGYCAYLGLETVAGIVGGGTIGTIVAAYVGGKIKREKDSSK